MLGERSVASITAYLVQFCYEIASAWKDTSLRSRVEGTQWVRTIDRRIRSAQEGIQDNDVTAVPEHNALVEAAVCDILPRNGVSARASIRILAFLAGVTDW